MNREYRTVRADITTDGTPGMFEAVVMRYGIVDDYDTIFDAGCFRESLEKRLPRITWAHDWKDVIGRYVDYRDTDDALTLIGQLDLDLIEGGHPAVQRAHQAYAQLRSGTIDQFSVGFRRDKGGVYKDDDEREHFQRVTLDESALVLSGAVPGTELVGVRAAARASLVATRAVRDAVGKLPQECIDQVLDWTIDGKVPESVAFSMLEAAGTVDLAAGGQAPLPANEGAGGSSSEAPPVPDDLDAAEILDKWYG